MTQVLVETTLADAIEQQINLGLKDPIEIAEAVERLHGEEWVRARVADMAMDVLAQLARGRLGSRRRAREPVSAAAANGSSPAARDFLLESKFVPDVGWKRIADLTAHDCRAVAEHHRMLVNVNGHKARLYLDFADAIDSAGVETLGQVRGKKRLLRELQLVEVAEPSA